MNTNQTAEQLDAAAAAHRKEAADSFDRCDTDGFISQWASGICTREAELQAEIVRNGGKAEFWGLYTADGKRVAAKMIEGQYGLVWLLRDDAADTFGRRFVPVNIEGKSRVQKKLGLTEVKEIAPAEAFITGRGHGLSGSAWAATKRTGDEWGLDSTVIA